MSFVSPASEMNIEGKRLSLSGFGGYIWLTIIVCLVFLSILSVIFKKFIRNPWRKEFLCLEYVWFFTSNVLQNPPDVFPRRTLTKLLLSGRFLGTSVLIKAYTGNLKSEMMVSRSIRINTIDDLLKSPGTKPAIRRLSLIESLLMKPERFTPEMARLATEATYYDRFGSTEFSSFPNGTHKYALLNGVQGLQWNIVINNQFREYLENSGIKLYIGKKNYFTEVATIPFSKKLPRRILEHVDYLTSRFVETGQSHRYMIYFNLRINRFVASDEGTTFNEITVTTIQELSIMFHFWSWGIGIACLTLCLEMIIGKILQKEPKSKQRDIRLEIE